MLQALLLRNFVTAACSAQVSFLCLLFTAMASERQGIMTIMPCLLKQCSYYNRVSSIIEHNSISNLCLFV